MGVLLKKKVIQGSGNGTADVTGLPYGRITSNGGPVSIGYTEAGKEIVRVYIGTDHEIQAPITVTSLKISCHASVSWQVTAWNVKRAVNQSELQASSNSNGGVSISGDDDIVYLGQDVAADISGIRVNYEELSKLYVIAIRTKNVNDCARYVKFKEKIIG